MLKDRIKELRENNNLTISAFARSLDISPASASLYESGRQNPGKKTIAKIREVYGVDEAWLKGSTPGAKSITETAQADEKTEAYTPVNEVADKTGEEKKSGRKAEKPDGSEILLTAEERKTGQKIDKAAVLARAEEAGVRKAAAEFGVTRQAVNRWKKDAEKAAAAALEKVMALMQSRTNPEALMPSPVELDKMFEETFQKMMEELDSAAETEPSDAEEKPEEKPEIKEEVKEEIKEEVKEEVKPVPPAIIIQSPMGGNITPEQIEAKIPPEANTVYVRVDENKLYWVNESENGHTDIW